MANNLLDPIIVEIREQYLWVTLRDKRVIGTPLEVFPWLQNASEEARKDFMLLQQTILWDQLDEGIDTRELLQGYSIPPAVLSEAE